MEWFKNLDFRILFNVIRESTLKNRNKINPRSQMKLVPHKPLLVETNGRDQIYGRKNL